MIFQNSSSKMRWFTIITCLYLVSARTEEDQSMTPNAEPEQLIPPTLSSSSSTPASPLPSPSPQTTTPAPVINTVPERCYYGQVSECPPPDSNPCKRITLSNATNEYVAVLCCNLANHTEFELALSRANFPGNVHYIHIRNATLDFINANEVRWRMLKSLAITDGKIHSIKSQFRMMTPMTCLNLSNNALTEIENNSLIRLSQLTTLDLSFNNFTHLPVLNVMYGRQLWLDICGTDTLLCHDIDQNINKTGENQIFFHRENKTFCTSSKTWNWFNDTTKVSLEEVRYRFSLQKECPKGDNWHCRCEIMRLELIKNKRPIFAVGVDCSNSQLTQLPEKLPRTTVFLNVSYNYITALDELSSNPNYDNLREFVADYNNISSINKLEGSKFIDNYSFLSLRYNKIKSLPTYILGTLVSDKSYSSRYGVRFGGNELHCDCNTAKFLKVWLQTRIMDYDEVLCENVKERVINLEPSKMCVYPGDWTDYIYYIIALEILLLIGLIAKVTYDYWVFKTAGYLPWPANKMPKLPCDWLCET